MPNSKGALSPRTITSLAPIRICDNGGWTDTWFAEHGCVFNIAVSPYAEVQIDACPYDGAGERIVIDAANYGDRYALDPDASGWGPHPLLEAAIVRMGIPDDLAVEISVFSEAPAGASTGTSAAVTVALLGALDRLTPGRLTPHQIASTAQSVEVDMLGQQCGIQDQLCAAYGGINYIEMSRYPQATVSPIRVPDTTWWELERRLALIYLGRAHSSSAVHERVIRELEDAGPDCPQLEALRATAARSRDAVYAADLAALGRAMIDNTEAQGRLHPALIGPDAQRVMEIAQAHGALGWKMNGAGGEGGSVTLLCGPRSAGKRTLVQEIEADLPDVRTLPIRLSRHGLRVWEWVGDA
jgi:D-glycero-alpha-D-manno-heptose-7-phosphate kinase